MQSNGFSPNLHTQMIWSIFVYVHCVLCTMHCVYCACIWKRMYSFEFIYKITENYQLPSTDYHYTLSSFFLLLHSFMWMQFFAILILQILFQWHKVRVKCTYKFIQIIRDYSSGSNSNSNSNSREGKQHHRNVIIMG